MDDILIYLLNRENNLKMIFYFCNFILFLNFIGYYILMQYFAVTFAVL